MTSYTHKWVSINYDHLALDIRHYIIIQSLYHYNKLLANNLRSHEQQMTFFGIGQFDYFNLTLWFWNLKPVIHGGCV